MAELISDVRALHNVFDTLTLKYWQNKPVRGENQQIYRSRKVMEVLGHNTLITDIDETHIDRLTLHFLNRGCEGSTINRYLAVLSKALKFCNTRYRTYGIERLPSLEWRKERKVKVRFLSEDEEKAMKKYFMWKNKEHILNFFMFLIESGVRVSEGLGIKYQDYNETFLTINGTKSNNAIRSVPLTPRARTILKTFEHSTIKPDDNIFEIVGAYAMLQYEWKHMRESIGLEKDRDFTIHMLRHTCATRMIKKGVHLGVIQKWLGHANISMTMKYSHLETDDLLVGVEALNAYGHG